MATPDRDNARPKYAYRPACRRCHDRKVRCDASEKPGSICSNCISARAECILHEKRRRGGVIKKVKTLIPLLPAQTDAEQNPSEELEDTWVPNSTTPAPITPGWQQNEPWSTPAASSNDEIRGAAATLSSLQEAGDHGAKRHLVEMLSQDDIDQRIMQRGVRVVYVGREYSNINYLIRHRARNEAAHHFPSNQISRQYTSHELDRIPKEAFALPSPAVVDELLEQYFTHVNGGFPILDEEVFMRQYRGRDPQNPPSLLVLQAVLMVGAHVSRDRPDRDELKTTFFRRAKMLFDARFEWNRDVVVQAALLLTWHSEGIEDVGANSYHWVGVAVRTAFGLGMHRDCGPSTLIAHDKRIWRRLWWILVQFDVMVTLSYGRPQAIDLDEADVPPLTHADFEGASKRPEIDFVIHQTELCCIISSVLQQRFGLKVSPQARTAALIKADQLLADWMINLPPQLRSGSPDSSTWSAMLHISYNNMLILLHRPSPKRTTLAVAVKPDDVEICSSAAGAMMSLFETAWQRGELRYLSVFEVNALFTAMIQLSAEMRVGNPVLAANGMRRFDIALEILRSLAEYWVNAEIILRLFEESSERLQQDLRLGKTKTYRQVSVNGHESLELQNSSHAVGMDPALDPNNWHGILSQESTALPTEPSLNEELDWNNLYWAYSGFPSLSPLSGLPLNNTK